MAKIFDFVEGMYEEFAENWKTDPNLPVADPMRRSAHSSLLEQDDPVGQVLSSSLLEIADEDGETDEEASSIFKRLENEAEAEVEGKPPSNDPTSETTSETQTSTPDAFVQKLGGPAGLHSILGDTNIGGKDLQPAPHLLSGDSKGATDHAGSAAAEFDLKKNDLVAPKDAVRVVPWEHGVFCVPEIACRVSHALLRSTVYTVTEEIVLVHDMESVFRFFATTTSEYVAVEEDSMGRV